MRRTSLVVLAVAALVAAAPPAPAGEPPCKTSEIDALLAAISAAPSSLRAVLDVVHHPETCAPEVGVRVAAVLWHRGGSAAAIGLQTLARHRDACVRAEALRGVAAVGLRVRDGLRYVEDAARARDTDERVAAFGALGRVGNGTHVPALLDALRTTDKATLQAAYRALTDLTGARNPWQADRWRYWWSEVSETAPARVAKALDDIEAGSSPTDVASAREVIDGYGWIDVGPVEEALRGWLGSSHARLRIEGYRAARALRLGELAEEVGSAFRYDRDPVAWPEGRTAALALGFPVDGVTPPPARRSQ